jgi:hypothetical protein
MASRHKIAWVSTRANIRRARALVAKYDADKVNPQDYQPPMPDDFDDLLSRIK